MSRFDDVFQRVIGHEGAYTPGLKGDPAGETKYGITGRTLQDAIAAGIVPTGTTVKDLTLEQAKAIYAWGYWAPLRAADLPQPLDEFAFDFAVNSGVQRVARILQRAAGTLPDGNVGPKTIEAIRAKRPCDLVRLVFVERALNFAACPHEELQENGHGWYARLFDVSANAIREGRC